MCVFAGRLFYDLFQVWTLPLFEPPGPKLEAGNGSWVGNDPGGWDEVSWDSGVVSPSSPCQPVSHLSQDMSWSLSSSPLLQFEQGEDYKTLGAPVWRRER